MAGTSWDAVGAWSPARASASDAACRSACSGEYLDYNFVARARPCRYRRVLQPVIYRCGTHRGGTPDGITHHQGSCPCERPTPRVGADRGTQYRYFPALRGVRSRCWYTARKIAPSLLRQVAACARSRLSSRRADIARLHSRQWSARCPGRPLLHILWANDCLCRCVSFRARRKGLARYCGGCLCGCPRACAPLRVENWAWFCHALEIERDGKVLTLLWLLLAVSETLIGIVRR